MTAPATADLDARVLAELPRALDDLRRLVAIPSVSADPAHAEDVTRCAEEVAALFRDAGVPDARVVTAAGSRPAVVGRRPAPAGAPTVLLYAHLDVQPVGDVADWSSAPFEATERDGRLWGRGTADDKGGIAVHLAALRALGDDLPVGVALLIEGEEEIGSPAIDAVIAAHAADLACDVVVVPDAVDESVGAPSITTALRGLVDLTVEVRTLTHAAHSGLFGGVVPCALTTLCRLVATLHDDKGDVAIAGLAPAERPGLRTIGGADDALLPGVAAVGTGTEAERLVLKPSVTVLGIDAPRTAEAANALVPTAKAKLSLRIPPTQDPQVALDLLTRHLEDHAEHGAQVVVTPGSAAVGWWAEPTALLDTAVRVLGEAFGKPCTEVGAGGSIPFVASLAAAMPQAQILITAVQDPETRAHATDESLHLATFERACVANARLLAELATAPRG